MIKLFLHICIQQSLISFSATPENIIFSSQIMCNLGKEKNTPNIMTYQKLQGKGTQCKLGKITFQILITEHFTSKAFLTWAAAYAYTPNSELNSRNSILINML